MNKRTPRLTGKALVKLLTNSGFEVVRVKGSHHFLKHSDGRATVVPVHSNENLGVGLLSKISRDISLNFEELQ